MIDTIDAMEQDEVEDIKQFLMRIDCAGYTKQFVANSIGIDILPYLTTNDLKEIGVKDIGSRRRIEQAIMQLQQDIIDDTSSVPPSTPGAILSNSGGNSNESANATSELTASNRLVLSKSSSRSMSTFTRTVNVLAAHEISFRELVLDPQPVGRGAFGVVFKGRWRGADVAVKRIGMYLDSEKLEDFRQEAAMMRKVRRRATQQPLHVH
jgi:hypothetical protein